MPILVLVGDMVLIVRVEPRSSLPQARRKALSKSKQCRDGSKEWRRCSFKNVRQCDWRPDFCNFLTLATSSGFVGQNSSSLSSKRVEPEDSEGHVPLDMSKRSVMPESPYRLVQIMEGAEVSMVDTSRFRRKALR